MNSPTFQTNDPVATRQLMEISQYSHDVRYKPAKFNLTADALSRPPDVPPGNAYCAEVDAVTISKQLVTTELHPSKILDAQTRCAETKNHLLGQHSPKIKVKQVDSRGVKLLCKVTGRSRPLIPSELRQFVLKACHDLDHPDQSETWNRIQSSYYWPKMRKEVSTYIKSCHYC